MKGHLPLILALTLFPVPFLPNSLLAQETELIAQDILPGLKEHAQAISVQIAAAENGGSGVIIGQQGENYLILTNHHVIRGSSQITVQTVDVTTHTASLVTDFQSDDDLALLEFTSDLNYYTADLATVMPLEEQAIIAVGYSAETGEFVTESGTIDLLPERP